MKKLLSIILLLIVSVIYVGWTYGRKQETNDIQSEVIQPLPEIPELPESYVLYNEMDLDSVVNFQAFEQALAGYNKIEDKKKEILTLIDFSKPLNEERLYVMDMANKELLFTSVVSHGRNSGDLYATSFSNKNGSNKSSLGFYLTEGTYYGGSGYSLILNGLEKGINDLAKRRSIVIHGSPSMEPSRLTRVGKLSRSLGCPALPKTISKEIIDVIKNGSLLFIYADDEKYLADSPILAGEQFDDSFMG